MEILDIHTHWQPLYPSQAIQSCLPEAFSPREGACYSVGIHPWYLCPESVESQWESLLAAVHHPQVVAIGEAGLDKLVDAPLLLQQSVFERQIELSESLNLPLVIHTVRAADELIALKKKYQPRQAWVIHGFRGKQEQALQYIHQGFYLSFGEHYQESALHVVPLDRLFLETDESAVDIHLLYDRAASVLGMSAEELIKRIQQNIQSVFFSH